MQNLPSKIFCIFQIISYFVYDNFKIIIVLITVNVNSSNSFLFISNHDGFCSSLSVFSSVNSLIIFFSSLLFLFFLTKYFKLVRVKKIFHLFHLNFPYRIFFVSIKVFVVKLIDIFQNSIFTIFCFIIEGL